MLYTEKDNIVLASEFKTNSKELKAILSPEGFDIEEHRIFSQFLVIISGVIEEYNRDIQVAASHVKTDSPSLLVQKHRSVSSENMPSLNHISTTRDVPLKTKVIASKLEQKEDTGAKGGFNSNKLVLKVNKPFKKPKRILSTDVVNELNRPSIRRQRVQKATPQLNVGSTDTKVRSVAEIVTGNDNTASCEFGSTTEASKDKDDPEEKRDTTKVTKSHTGRVGRIRKIVHEPLRI